MKPEQIEQAMAILKEQVLTDDLLEPEYWITFDEIAQYSFDIEFWYAIKKWWPHERAIYSDWYQKKSLAKTRLNLAILRAFEQHNIKLALPLEGRVWSGENVDSVFSGQIDFTKQNS